MKTHRLRYNWTKYVHFRIRGSFRIKHLMRRL
jgi:hypothetical protein